MLRLPRHALLLAPLLTALLLVPAAAQGAAPLTPADLHCPAPVVPERTFVHPADPTDRLMQAGFRQMVWIQATSRLRDDYADPNLNGVNWDDLMAEFEPRAQAVRSDAEFYAVLREFTARLNDDHTSFRSPAQVQEARRQLQNEQSLVGVGVRINWTGGPEHLYVIGDLVPDGPAQRAGLRRGDVIVSIDGERCGPYTRLRGQEGTTVVTEVWRPGQGLVTADVRRAPVRFDARPTVARLPQARTVVLVSIPTFYLQGMGRMVLDGLERELQQGDVTGVIIDVRDNSGGLTGEGLETLGAFTTQPTALSTYRDGTREELLPGPSALLEQLGRVPLAVLVNEHSHSMSELLSGGLQVAGRAVVVGEATRGFAGGSASVPLLDGSELSLRIQTLSFPLGRPLQDGVTPDVEVEQRWSVTPDEDPVVREALRQLYRFRDAVPQRDLLPA